MFIFLYISHYICKSVIHAYVFICICYSLVYLYKYVYMVCTHVSHFGMFGRVHYIFLFMASSVIYTKIIKLIVKLDFIYILVDFHKAC